MASSANDFAHEKGLSKEDVSKRYTEWSRNKKYEEDLNEANYKGPTIANKTLCEQFPSAESRKTIKILDVAAGSGLAGEKLTNSGFQHIDALEPSEGMLNLAKEKNIYKRHFLCYLSSDPNDIEKDYYDVALICGGMGEGHIPCSGLDEFIRVVRPGGLCIIVMREAYLQSVTEYKDRLEPRMKELAAENKWEQVSRTVVPKYSFDNNGIIYIFRKK